jgi:hypothetical protein
MAFLLVAQDLNSRLGACKAGALPLERLFIWLLKHLIKILKVLVLIYKRYFIIC